MKNPIDAKLSTKERILSSLEKNKGSYVSGETLAGDCMVSRNAVWKNINELRKAGYRISSVNNRGYMLEEESDIISLAGIMLHLEKLKKAGAFEGRIYVYDEIDSTNTEAKRSIISDENDLPLTLPELADYKPTGTGEPPLAKATDWVNVVDPKTGKKGVRETNTMPQWAGSCWYYLRYIDPANDKCFADPGLLKKWLPVDLYVGGAEHAVLHLLYARFWHKVLFDLGYVPTPEPFQRLVNQGMILGMAYKTKRGVLVPMDKIEWRDGKPYGAEEGGEMEELTEFPAKMSKSLKNVVNPDDVIRDYGADSLRLYEMFMGPLQAVKPWSTKGVEGVYRFLKRANRLVTETPVADRAMTKAEAKSLAAMVKKVGEDLETMNFNTGISAMMVFVNEAEDFAKAGGLPKEYLEKFVLCLSPFAPHLGEELWQFLGHDKSLAYEPWPKFDPAALVEDEIEIPVQVMGKLRGRVMVPVAATPAEMEAAAKANADVAKFLEGKTIVKVVAVPKRMVNFVVR